MRKPAPPSVAKALTLISALALLWSCSGGSAEPVRGEVIAPDVPEFQARLIEGGVTFSEYESAVLTAMSCLNDAGIDVEGPHLEQGGRFLSFDFGIFPEGTPDSEVEAASQAMSRCEDEYLTYVVDAYTKENQPSEAEVAERERLRRECAADLGFDISGDSPDSALYDLLLSYPDVSVCLDRHP